MHCSLVIKRRIDYTVAVAAAVVVVSISERSSIKIITVVYHGM